MSKCWNMTRISFDISPDIHQQFKLYCIEHKTTITDEISKSINETLKAVETQRSPQPNLTTEKEPQETVVIDGQTVIDDIDSDDFNAPTNPTTVKITAVAQANEKVYGILNMLVPTVAELVQGRDNLRVRQDSKFADFDKKFSEIDKKFAVAGRLVESAMNALEQTSPAKKCEDDLKGLALLKGES